MDKAKLCKQCLRRFLPKKSNKIYCEECSDKRKKYQDKKSKRSKRGIEKEERKISNTQKEINENAENVGFSEKFNELLSKPTFLWTDKEKEIIMKGSSLKAMFSGPEEIDRKGKEKLRKIFNDKEKIRKILDEL